MDSSTVLAILGIIGGAMTGFAALLTALSTARNAASKADLDKQQGELNGLKTIIDTQAAELARLREIIAQMTAENNALRQRNATLQSQVDALQSEVDKLQRKAGKGWA